MFYGQYEVLHGVRFEYCLLRCKDMLPAVFPSSFPISSPEQRELEWGVEQCNLSCIFYLLYTFICAPLHHLPVSSSCAKKTSQLQLLAASLLCCCVSSATSEKAIRSTMLGYLSSL